jgi:hypothetical protein
MNEPSKLQDLERALGHGVKAVQVNAPLIQIMRKLLLMCERGECIGGVFVGLQPNGLTIEGTSVPTGPAEPIIATSLRIASKKLEDRWEKTNSAPLDPSPILKPVA